MFYRVTVLVCLKCLSVLDRKNVFQFSGGKYLRLQITIKIFISVLKSTFCYLADVTVQETVPVSVFVVVLFKVLINNK